MEQGRQAAMGSKRVVISVHAFNNYQSRISFKSWPKIREEIIRKLPGGEFVPGATRNRKFIKYCSNEHQDVYLLIEESNKCILCHYSL